MKNVNRGVKTEGLIDEFSYNGNSSGPYLLIFVSKKDIDGKVNIKGYILVKTEVHQAFDLSIVRIVILALAFKED